MGLATQIMAPGRVEFVQCEVPALQPGQVLIRTLLVSLCGSDVHLCYYSAPQMYPFPVGTTGHEIIGRVEAVNAAGSSLAVGDLALVLRANQQGMAEWLAVPEADVLPLPPGTPIEQLLMGQQLGTVIYSCRRLPSIVDQDVAVIGQGSAGLFWNVMCRRLGARRVIALDLQPHRVAAACRFSATHAIDNAQVDPVAAVREILDGRLADVVIEAAGETASIALAPQLVQEGGLLFYFGIPRADRLEFDFGLFFRKYCRTLSLAGAMLEPGGRSFRLALEMIANHQVDVTGMITHRLPFAAVPEALALARSCGDGVIKIVIEMPGYQPDLPYNLYPRTSPDPTPSNS